jgi:hypothetical protein
MQKKAIKTEQQKLAKKIQKGFQKGQKRYVAFDHKNS